MNKEQVISQLKSLQRDAKSHIDKDDKDDIFRADYEALGEAIKIIENSMQVKEYEILKEKNKLVPIIRRALKQYPKVADLLAVRHIEYNDTLKYIEEREKIDGKLVGL